MAIVGKVVGSLGLGLTALVGYGVYLEWNVHRWDRRIDALCAANGGKDVAVRVYETAVAPETKEYFAETKPVRSFRVPTRRAGEALGPEFPFVVEIERAIVLNASNPTAYKLVTKLVRVSDNKVLGEQADYVRAGGGIPLPNPSTPHSCQSAPNSPGLDVSVFLNHPSRLGGAVK